MDSYIRWFQRFIWIGIVMNMVFALPALFAPALLTSVVGLPPVLSDPWLENAGMLLVGISVFYMPSGFNARRFPIHSWLCVLTRLIAVAFWIYLIDTSNQASVFFPMLMGDLSMFLILGILLYLGSPPAERPWALLASGWHSWCHGWAVRWQRHGFRVGLLVTVLVLGFIGYQTWYNMLRVVPEEKFASDEDHFKYAAIGLGIEARIPYYLFAVLPQMCPEKMPRAGAGWESFGFLYENGRDLPIGMAKRQIGYPTVEPNCALCHTGSYRASASDVARPIATAPANTLQLQAFQWFAYDCASDPKFTTDAVMTAINGKFQLGFFERLYNRYLIIPMAKTALLKQKQAYAWQKLRPAQGPGRTDTFNPTKMVVFGFPDDSTIGTVDLPQIWNQKPRESLYLHWDGNNNDIHERNYAAAMAVGATPQSVLPASFNRVTNWLLGTKPPAWPFALDQARVAQGKPIWDNNCAGCHEFGKADTGQVTTRIDQLGTDPHRLDSFTVGLVQAFHGFKKPPFDFNAYRKTQSYSNTPTDGVWMRAPYLHNGSVPSLWDLLQTPDKRPVTFSTGSDVYDPVKVGFVTSGQQVEAPGYFKYDTRLEGNHNSGHLYGTQLTDAEKWALIEFMKTL
ncbi:c-type cytochrome [Pseudomonas gingeri]